MQRVQRTITRSNLFSLKKTKLTHHQLFSSVLQVHRRNGYHSNQFTQQQQHLTDKLINSQKFEKGSRNTVFKRVFGIALISSLSLPILLLVFGKYLCEYLNEPLSESFDELMEKIDMDDMRLFVNKLLTHHSAFLKDHLGDVSHVKFTNDAVLIDVAKTYYLSAKLVRDNSDGQTEVRSHHLKGVANLYFPIDTDKGNAFIKVTLVSGESEQKNMNLHKYRVLVIPVQRDLNMRALANLAFEGVEEENRNHVMPTGDQLLELFTPKSPTEQMANSMYQVLTCVTIPKDILIYQSQSSAAEFKKREAYLLEYTKHTEPRIIHK